LSTSVEAQESVNIVIGERYGAGALQRAILGGHYRDAWTSEVRLPVLNLETFAGGLTPERKGGGQQTISLILLGGNGRRYSFRLIDKDPTPALPPELRGTAAAALLQDQISASHPLGILVVNALEDAAGVLHAESEPFVMPDDPALGEFRSEFAGQAGMISERPGDEENPDAIFGGFDNIDGGNRIFRRVAERSDAARRLTRIPECAPVRLADRRLGSTPRAMDLGEASRLPAVAPDCRRSRPSIFPLRWFASLGRP